MVATPLMKILLQNLKTGETELVESPCPQVRAGHLLIEHRMSLPRAPQLLEIARELAETEEHHPGFGRHHAIIADTPEVLARRSVTT